MNNYRHGDLLIKQIDELPENLKKVDGGVLAEGEATGHSHTIVADRKKIQLYEDDNGMKYFSLIAKSPLTHQEHDTIEIEKGFYRVEIEQDFNPFTEELNRVRD